MEINNSGVRSKLTIRGVNVIYLLVMVLFITLGSYVQTQDFEIGILVTEFGLIVVPVLLYVAFKRGNLKYELRLNRLRFLDALLVTLIFCFAYPIAIFVNSIGNIFLSLFGKLIQSPIPIPSDFNEYFILLLIIAGSAGVCEEILFRGLIMRGYEKLGRWKSIVLTAVLFAILHINIQNIFGPLFLGILLGYVVSITNSLFAGMLGHFVNNAISVSIGYLVMQLPFSPEAVPQDIPNSVMVQSLIMAIMFFAFISMVTGPIMYFCLRALKEINMERRNLEEDSDYSAEGLKIRSMLASAKLSWPLYVSLCIFVFFSIVQFVFIATGRPLLDLIF